LKALTKEEIYRILTEPENNLIKQTKALLSTENIQIEITEDAIKEISNFCHEINSYIENIGARRLNTVIEKIIHDISFEACDYEEGTKIIIDTDMVKKKLEPLMKHIDLSKYVL